MNERQAALCAIASKKRQGRREQDLKGGDLPGGNANELSSRPREMEAP
jgi:hypothetical protein